MFRFLYEEKHARTFAITASILALLSGGALTLAFADSTTGGNHAPISITVDSDFTPLGATSGCACVASGHGTPSDPFVIQQLTIMGTSSAPAIKIDGTGGTITTFFTLTHITIQGVTTEDGIDLVNVNGLSSGQSKDLVKAVNIDGAANGIFLSGTSGVTITGNSINNAFLWGIELANSHDNIITFMTVAHSGLSNPTSYALPDSLAVFLQTKFAGGVLFWNSNHNVLNDSALPEDGYAGFVLIQSDGNTIARVNNRYSDFFGGVLQDSSSNTLDTVSLQANDFVGLVVRGGGSNTIINSAFSTNGPIGQEWNSHIVPYFISGIYLGWGTQDNTIKNDHSNSGNTGPSLVVDLGAGSVINPIPAITHLSAGAQTVNPLNDGTTGNDLGLVPLGFGILSDIGVSTAVGSGNTICGNTFANLAGSNFPSANNPC